MSSLQSSNNNFDTDRVGTGTREWADITYNICSGCIHDCCYCYSKYNATKRWKRIKEEDWIKEVIDWKRVNKKHKKYDGVVMFPSTHDITENNYQACLTTIVNILKGGNDILIVSKPKFDVIVHLCDRLIEYKNNILFRFTIGSDDDTVLKALEPGAPNFDERIHSLGYAYTHGYKTSVSMEPLLIDDVQHTIRVINILNHYVTNDIWVGKINKIDQRINTNDHEVMFHVNKIKEFQENDNNIIKLVNHYKNNNKIKWKDSIKQVVNKCDVKT